MSELKGKLEIERKWFLFKFPNDRELKKLPIVLKDVIQHYTPEGRFRREINIKTGISEYFHTIKTDIADGIMDEDEVTISLEKFTCSILNSDGYVEKLRVEWVDGEVHWFLDVLEDIILLEAEIPRIDYPIQIPHFLQECIFAEVTNDKRFKNYNLRKRINENSLSHVQG